MTKIWLATEDIEGRVFSRSVADNLFARCRLYFIEYKYCMGKSRDGRITSRKKIELNSLIEFYERSIESVVSLPRRKQFLNKWERRLRFLQQMKKDIK